MQEILQIPKIEEKNEIESYEGTGWTALMTAWVRCFSDIPYAEEVYQVIERLIVRFSAEEKKYLPDLCENAPVFEARDKLTDKILFEVGTKQVFEIAPGYSPRSTYMTEDPSIKKYVELDQPNIIADKEIIIDEIFRNKGEKKPANLFLVEGDALRFTDISKAVSHLEAGTPTSIVCEGLLRYLSRTEIKILANHIRAILKRSGGVWITPDIFTLEGSEDDGVKNKENYFRDEAEAKKFFEEIGFTVESRSFQEVADDLFSPENINMPAPKVLEKLKHRRAFIMRPQSYA